ncbi:hypothetical protein [Microvirga calopogonii]|uniref:hypothetical protein n=1 Tax=Microvirga calopogonii TaxID=2078013 RepID=UPI0013B43E59|nr:hypothetical protein [Microvirga calopogonii]
MSYTKRIMWRAAMENRHMEPRPQTASFSQSPPHDPATSTVASLGVRLHVAPANVERERQLRNLIASCETLRAEWERLFQQVIALLDEETSIDRGINRPSPLSDHD